MFCNTPQVNQLTALLLSHHITDIVVCPGSRNATIVHNLNELKGRINIHPVTDERSAAFVALGMTLATEQAVAVCVTSGSALLNCIPAVAEAYYRHLPLLVISADRPAQWINQLDGQTLPQQQALMPYCCTYSVSTPHTPTDLWQNNRNINEAILRLQHHGGGPSHINVAIEEPMFSFTTATLPNERIIKEFTANEPSSPLPQEVIQLISNAQLPALIIGQYEKGDIRQEVDQLISNNQLLVLPEIISDVKGSNLLHAFDHLSTTDAAIKPDVIVQIGGNFVHKKFKLLLRNIPCKVVRIGTEQHMPDTFCHLSYWVHADVSNALNQLASSLPKQQKSVAQAYAQLMQVHSEQAAKTATLPNKLTMHTALTVLKEHISQLSPIITLHLANSSAVRAAGLVFESGTFPIYCNRGVNGIEGSLSAAVGYALKMWGLSIVVIGDLSFFYDANALWNTHLPTNLRILLLNNGHGAIFDQLPGLSASQARDEFIAAGGKRFTAQGICASYDIAYQKVQNAKQLADAMPHFLNEECTIAQLIEITLN